MSQLTYPTFEDRAKAILQHLAEGDIGIGDMKKFSYDDQMVDVCNGREEWIVCTDSEANDRVEDYIRESVWAFKAWFIADYVPDGISIRDIESIQGARYEDANSVILALINAGDGIDAFVRDAIDTDGRGHFMSGYDGEEVEVSTAFGTFYLYRQS